MNSKRRREQSPADWSNSDARKPPDLTIMPFLLKTLLTALLIGLIAEIAKRNSFFGALTASLPLMSILAMVWLYRDTGDVAKIADFARGVFWLVLPSLVLFALLPPLLVRWQLSFPLALALASAATVGAYFAMVAVLRVTGMKW